LTHEGILALRLRLSMSQSEFGRALGALRGVPYGRSYMAKLEGGDVPITAAIERAVQALDAPTQHLHVLPAKVYAVEDLPPGTIVLGRPVVCPSCRRVYVMPWPTQVYCSAECKRAARRERRKTHPQITQTLQGQMRKKEAEAAFGEATFVRKGGRGAESE